LSLLESNCL